MLRGWVAFLRGDADSAAETMRDVAARQRAEAQATGSHEPFLSWTLLNWGYVARAQGDVSGALALFLDALKLGWQFQDLRCCARALAGVAGVTGIQGGWRDAAHLYGAVEAFCQLYGLGFGAIWELERAFGIPEEWWPVEEPLGKEAELIRAVVLARGSDSLVRFPTRQQMSEEWQRGRADAFAVAMATAFALDEAPTNADSAAQMDTSTPHTSVRRSDLTNREQEILGFLCQRLTNTEIASRLFIIPKTAENHVGNVLGKLGVANRRDAAALAVRTGLV